MPSNSPAQYVIQSSYHDFDDLVSDMRKWDLDLRQIDRGLFRGEVLQFGIADVHVSEGRFGRVLEQRLRIELSQADLSRQIQTAGKNNN